VQAVISNEAARATPTVSMMVQLLFIGSTPQSPALLKNPISRASYARKTRVIDPLGAECDLVKIVIMVYYNMIT